MDSSFIRGVIPALITPMNSAESLSRDGMNRLIDGVLDAGDLDALSEGARELLTEEDPEVQEMARLELEELLEARDLLDEDIKLLLLPRDPDDDKDIVYPGD